mmetsp:Transcript_75707/g.118338  ORF Transcript_75707/g.118338 Transcript_75707/m.118338 type:complete len:108 (+) Transcript_75707:90-413(+)
MLKDAIERALLHKGIPASIMIITPRKNAREFEDRGSQLKMDAKTYDLKMDARRHLQPRSDLHKFHACLSVAHCLSLPNKLLSSFHPKRSATENLPGPETVSRAKIVI